MSQNCHWPVNDTFEISAIPQLLYESKLSLTGQWHFWNFCDSPTVIRVKLSLTGQWHFWDLTVIWVKTVIDRSMTLLKFLRFLNCNMSQTVIDQSMTFFCYSPTVIQMETVIDWSMTLFLQLWYTRQHSCRTANDFFSAIPEHSGNPLPLWKSFKSFIMRKNHFGV